MKEPARIHIFSGNNSVDKELAKTIAKNAIIHAVPGVVRELFDPSEDSFDDFMWDVLSPTLFGDTRLFSINHAESLTACSFIKLGELFDSLPDDIYLIIDVENIGQRNNEGPALVKKLKIIDRVKAEPNKYVYRDFQRPPDYKTAQWISENVHGWCGRTIGRDAADLLVDLAGHDTAVLYSEIQKIDIHLEPGRNIDRAAVENIVTKSRPISAFELANACGFRDGHRVLQIIDTLFASSCSVPMIIVALYRHYGALLRILYYGNIYPGDIKIVLSGSRSDEKNESALRVGIAAGLLRDGEKRRVYPAIIASGIVKQAAGYTVDQLEKILALLGEFDYEIKSGRRKGIQREVELLCFQLLRPNT